MRPEEVDLRAELAGLRDRLNTVLTAMKSQAKRKVTFDLDDPNNPDLYFVLTQALQEFASREHFEAEQEDQEPDGGNAASRRAWAEAAEAALARIENA